ncbi:MAG: hypothetical protein K6G31_05385 [Paludibacteraceae bacterium]|nr:hypothetical protein [Paludibacteraceae bacterium]MCR5568690.1 hypothetical protein [Paludibacteraceae bacterium]
MENGNLSVSAEQIATWRRQFREELTNLASSEIAVSEERDILDALVASYVQHGITPLTIAYKILPSGFLK